MSTRRRRDFPLALPGADPFDFPAELRATYLADQDGYDHDADQEDWFRWDYESRHTRMRTHLSTHAATGVSVWLIVRAHTEALSGVA